MISSVLLREPSLCSKLRLNAHIQDSHTRKDTQIAWKSSDESAYAAPNSIFPLRSQCGSAIEQTKRPPGNRAAFSFQGRIVPTEAKDPVKTFWTKSYEPKKQGVKQFLGNKCL
jgi:hypothetical protein